VKDSLVSKLIEIAGKDNVKTSIEDRIAHSYDATLYTQLPGVVVSPTTTDQVAGVMKLAYEEEIPVTPRGCGTGLSGGAVPSEGGISLAMTRMNKIKEVDAENLMAVAEPGVINQDLDKLVESMGLFYPPDPLSKKACSMGGNVAEGAGGPRAFKYGCTRQYVKGLEVVLANGDVLKTGSRTVKYVTGFDLTGLFTASEGALGVMTEITVQLLPKPAYTETMLAIYDDVWQAGRTVSEIVAAGIIPSVLEFMDSATTKAVEAYAKVGLPADADAVLLIETDGHAEAAREDIAKCVEICQRCKATRVQRAHTAEEREGLWKARRSAMAAITRINPSLIQEDPVVPRSKVADLAKAVLNIGERYNLHMCSYGHAGDGNLHPSILTDIRDPAAMKRAREAVKALFDCVLALGGTLSGEHGIGREKAPYLRQEVGDVGIATMKALKDALDPKGILNPGKIFVN